MLLTTVLNYGGEVTYGSNQSTPMVVSFAWSRYGTFLGPSPNSKRTALNSQLLWSLLEGNKMPHRRNQSNKRRYDSGAVFVAINGLSTNDQSTINRPYTNHLIYHQPTANPVGLLRHRKNLPIKQLWRSALLIFSMHTMHMSIPRPLGPSWRTTRTPRY